MADLDDFFAKKDKKKSKGKKVAGTSVAPGSGSEQDASTAPQPAKKAEKKKEGDTEASKKAGEEEEWADFQEEREKDYSGLKIQKLQIQETEDSPNQVSSEHELNEEGEMVKREPAGPWNKAQTTGPATAPVPVKETEVAAPALPNTSGGVYVPPSRRGQQATEPAAARSKIGRKTVVPDLNKEELFPTLSAAIAIEQAAPKTKKQLEQSTFGFTEAKPSRSHSSRGAVAGEEGPRLHLGNKFDALSENS